MCHILTHLYLWKHFVKTVKPLRVNDNNLPAIISHACPAGRQQASCLVCTIPLTSYHKPRGGHYYYLHLSRVGLREVK